MRYFLLGCAFLVSCGSGTRIVAKKEEAPKEVIYPYSCVYKNYGTVTIDSTKKTP